MGESQFEANLGKKLARPYFKEQVRHGAVSVIPATGMVEEQDPGWPQEKSVRSCLKNN
jgi:hypothetical protein